MILTINRVPVILLTTFDENENKSLGGNPWEKAIKMDESLMILTKKQWKIDDLNEKSRSGRLKSTQVYSSRLKCTEVDWNALKRCPEVDWSVLKWTEMQFSDWFVAVCAFFMEMERWSVLKCTDVYWSRLKSTEVYWIGKVKCTDVDWSRLNWKGEIYWNGAKSGEKYAFSTENVVKIGTWKGEVYWSVLKCTDVDWSRLMSTEKERWSLLKNAEIRWSLWNFFFVTWSRLKWKGEVYWSVLKSTEKWWAKDTEVDWCRLKSTQVYWSVLDFGNLGGHN